jgi:uncharacterized protein YggE
MKNKIGAVVIFFILLFVFAKWGPAINFNTTSQTKGEAFIVSGEGKVYATPDIAKITLGIEETNTSIKTVQNSVSIKSKTLIDAIKKLGIEEEDIKTTSYNLYPQYDYQSSVSRITGYRVSTTYQITVRDFDKINDLIASATATGANMQGSISFELNEDTQKEKLKEAREKAVAEAKSKAEGLSKAAGMTLGKIINISESQGSNEIRPVYASGEGIALDKSAVTPSIQAGQTEINVVISLSYETR